MTIVLQKITAIIAILGWFAIGLYTGVCGLIYEEYQEKKTQAHQTVSDKLYNYDGINFSSQERVNEYIDKQKTEKVAAWISWMPDLLMVVLSSCGLGAIGGVVAAVRTNAFQKVPIEDTQYIALPFMGFMLGIVILAISYIIPTLLVMNSDIAIRQTTIMCFCLFTGLFSKSFLTWLERRFGSLLKDLDKPTENTNPQT